MPLLLKPAIQLMLSFSNQDFRKRIILVNNAELTKYLKPESIPEHLKNISGSGYALGNLFC